MSAGTELRRTGPAARAARALIAVQIALCALAAALAWMRGFDPAALAGPEILLGLVQFLVFIGAMIALLRWIYLAHVNARAFGADDMMGSPGWAVGWFFIPFANLVMPFLMMRELWKASSGPKDWQGQAAPAAILAWWLFWIASGVASSVGFRLELEGNSEILPAAQMGFFLSDLLSIPALLLLGWIIGRIQEMQARSEPGSVEALRDRFA